MGVTLVVLALSGVGLVVQESTQTRVIAVTLDTVVAGQRLSSADVQEVSVPDSAVFDSYATPDDLSNSQVAIRSLPAGELIPLDAVGVEPMSDDSVVTLELSIGQPEWLQAGAVAELWVAPPAAENSFLAPFVLAPSITILHVTKDEGFAADSVTTRVDILVSRRHMAGVIHALANRYFVHLSPAGGLGP
jgi:hypothetical protein